MDVKSRLPTSLPQPTPRETCASLPPTPSNPSLNVHLLLRAPFLPTTHPRYLNAAPGSFLQEMFKLIEINFADGQRADFLQEIRPVAFKRKVKDSFTAVFEFLEQCAPEVAGRAVIEPDLAVLSKLQRFARGACNPREREEVCTLLRTTPVWLRWLAKEVKEARVGSERREVSL